MKISDYTHVATRFGTVAHLTEEDGYTSDGPVETLCGREFVPYHPEGARVCKTCNLERIHQNAAES